MAGKKLRLGEPDGIYHVNNGGNYRRELFQNVGAACAFVGSLFEAAARFSWRVHANVLMRNRFHLVQFARDEQAWAREAVVGLSKDWAIRTSGWRKALTKEYAQTALSRGLARADRVALREARWEAAVDLSMARIGKRNDDLNSRPLKQPWKLQVAQEVRCSTGRQPRWLAKRQHLGQSGQPQPSAATCTG